MKVQILSNLFPLPWEPNRAAFNRQQFEWLARKCEVRIIVIVSFLDRIKNFGKSVPSIKNGVSISYLWYFYVPKFARFSYTASLLLSMIFKIPQIVKYKPDCLILSWAYPDAVSGIILSKMLNIPAVIKVHGSDINLHLQHRARAAQILWSMMHAKAIISVSKDLAAKLVKLGVPENKIHVIYNGVDKSIFYPRVLNETKKILQLSDKRTIWLYIGNLKPEKGCIDLFSAFEAIAAKKSTIDLYYVGTGGSADYIKNKAIELGLAKRVTLLGNLGHKDVATWINASDLVALPSYNEGVPNVLLEAMACGKPVVASRVGGIPEVIPEHAGILFNPGDIAALEGALLECSERHWNSTDIINSVQELTWENNSSKVYDLLNSAVLHQTESNKRD
ncbi:MAG: sugar ABC transporter permease [SAR86 cluster bacterium]|uniref:Sugar ABC transporter permease n=1 Tax=SAR86 cluster bacterium TaxID=2030880 RepID=A0A2A5B6T1_9GAMM|nr:MAG: sugar ABC transporter permease [SAR86 cluster bacterium]